MQISITNGTLTQVEETLVATQGYNLPTSISVSGATSNYNSTTGDITLTSPTSTMSITASGVETMGSLTFGNNDIESVFFGNNSVSKVYYGNKAIYKTFSITTTITNGTYTGRTSISNNGTTTITLSANSGYKLPNTISVSGATYTYNSTTGVVVLSQPIGDITISCVCVQWGGTDLTGTTWQFGTQFWFYGDVEPYFKNYNAEGTMIINNSTIAFRSCYLDNYARTPPRITSFSSSTGETPRVVGCYYHNQSPYKNYNGWHILTGGGGYSDTPVVSPPIITFTGGTAMTDSQFISFVRRYATLISW